MSLVVAIKWWCEGASVEPDVATCLSLDLGTHGLGNWTQFSLKGMLLAILRYLKFSCIARLEKCSTDCVEHTYIDSYVICLPASQHLLSWASAFPEIHPDMMRRYLNDHLQPLMLLQGSGSPVKQAAQNADLQRKHFNI